MGDSSFRELLIKSYRLIYRVSEEKAVILALIHGARRAGRVDR
jgi:mRNA-degrading endonuclease RelE of RelBE toxin-antitoxin system